MIVVKLMGGLGNQMFEFAAGYAVARARGVPLRLDVSSFREHPKRTYALDGLCVDVPIADDGLVREARGELRRGDRLRAALRLRRPRTWTYIRERHFDFDSEVLRAPAYSFLDGYWQSERYFAAVQDHIRSAFRTRAAPGPKSDALLRTIAGAQAVAVHVRRGDYVHEASTSAFHGSCSPEYYERALAMIGERVKNPRIFLFSDEPDAARAMLRTTLPVDLVDHNGPDHPHDDLRLMSACKHFVLANSTFSWWGAWLSESPGKVVIGPDRWFADPSVNTRDLFPPGWIRL